MLRSGLRRRLLSRRFPAGNVVRFHRPLPFPHGQVAQLVEAAVLRTAWLAVRVRPWPPISDFEGRACAKDGDSALQAW